MPPAKKAAATKRTARPKVQTWEQKRKAILAKRPAVGKKNEWVAYDRTWHIKRPNIALMSQLEEIMGQEEVSFATLTSTLMTYLAAHIVKEERDEFLEALTSDEDLDIDVINGMIEDMTIQAFGDLPT